MVLFSAVLICNITISSGGRLGYFGWSADKHLDVIEHGSAAVADNVVFFGRSMHVSSGGVENYTEVKNGGSMYVHSSGVANSITVNFGGSLCISSGGVASAVTVRSAGHLRVSSGGTALAVTRISGADIPDLGGYIEFE